MFVGDHPDSRHGFIFDKLRFHLHPDLPRQQPLHQAAFLLVEGVSLGAEEGEFLVGGVEDGGDLALFFEGGGEADGFAEEDGGIEDEFLDVDAGAGDISALHSMGRKARSNSSFIRTFFHSFLPKARKRFLPVRSCCVSAVLRRSFTAMRESSFSMASSHVERMSAILRCSGRGGSETGKFRICSELICGIAVSV